MSAEQRGTGDRSGKDETNGIRPGGSTDRWTTVKYNRSKKRKEEEKERDRTGGGDQGQPTGRRVGNDDDGWGRDIERGEPRMVREAERTYTYGGDG